jgi:hypothetical protein
VVLLEKFDLIAEARLLPERGDHRLFELADQQVKGFPRGSRRLKNAKFNFPGPSPPNLTQVKPDMPQHGNFRLKIMYQVHTRVF